MSQGTLRAMSAGYKLKSIDELDDAAAGFGLGEHGEARFAREPLGMRDIGMSHYTWGPASGCPSVTATRPPRRSTWC